MHPRLTVGIVTPATPETNNGNWRTAVRWARMLAPQFRTRVLQTWRGEPVDLLIALHARRSAASIAAWAAARDAHRAGPLIVALTGTDLYRDIHHDQSAQRSLQHADALIVLQENGADALPAALRTRTSVIYQSGGRRATLPKTSVRLRALMVGHLRDEKSPQTYFAAARLLRDRNDIVLDHIGAALNADLEREARAAMAECPAYHWLGALPHRETLRRIQRAHVLVHPSRMEGGAHVILEAIRSGTPVLASDIPGNVGMLGRDYAGYFPVGDAAALRNLLVRCRDEPAWLAELARAGRQRAPRFEPAEEQRRLRRMVAQCLQHRMEGNVS